DGSHCLEIPQIPGLDVQVLAPQVSLLVLDDLGCRSVLLPSTLSLRSRSKKSCNFDISPRFCSFYKVDFHDTNLKMFIIYILMFLQTFKPLQSTSTLLGATIVLTILKFWISAGTLRSTIIWMISLDPEHLTLSYEINQIAEQ